MLQGQQIDHQIMAETNRRRKVYYHYTHPRERLMKLEISLMEGQSCYKNFRPIPPLCVNTGIVFNGSLCICSLDYNNARGCFPAQEFLFGLHLSTCEQAQKIKTILKKPLLQFCWRQFTQVKTFYAYGHKEEEVSFWPILWEMKPCPPPSDPWPN